MLFAGLEENERGFNNACMRSTSVTSTSHRHRVNSSSMFVLGTLEFLFDVYAHKQHNNFKLSNHKQHYISIQCISQDDMLHLPCSSLAPRTNLQIVCKSGLMALNIYFWSFTYYSLEPWPWPWFNPHPSGWCIGHWATLRRHFDLSWAATSASFHV